MLKRISEVAERFVTKSSVSRRGFLRRAGEGSLVIAGALTGLLFFGGDAKGMFPTCCRCNCGLNGTGCYFVSGPPSNCDAAFCVTKLGGTCTATAILTSCCDTSPVCAC